MENSSTTWYIFCHKNGFLLLRFIFPLLILLILLLFLLLLLPLLLLFGQRPRRF